MLALEEEATVKWFEQPLKGANLDEMRILR